MSKGKSYQLFCGADTGYLKAVDVVRRTFVNLNKGSENLDRDHEITELIWANPEQTQIHCALRNQIVNTYDANTGLHMKSFAATAGSGPIKGLELLNGSLVTCSQSGAFRVWRENHPIEIDVGADVYRMRKSPFTPEIFATGGKENDLKIWDVTNTQKPIFMAKNVRNDKLSLRVPIWVTDLRFLEENVVVVATGYNKLRLYDFRERQRRPILETDFDTYPITSLSIAPSREKSVLVGNTHGRVGLIDLRTTRLVHCFKGFAGSVRSVQAHPTKNYVYSVSLDRFLRVHDFEKHSLLVKVYLKSRLSSLLIRTQCDGSDEEEQDIEMIEDVQVDETTPEKPNEEDEDDVDAIWESIQASDAEQSDADENFAENSVNLQPETSPKVTKTKKRKKVSENPETKSSKKRAKKSRAAS